MLGIFVHICTRCGKFTSWIRTSLHMTPTKSTENKLVIIPQVPNEYCKHEVLAIADQKSTAISKLR